MHSQRPVDVLVDALALLHDGKAPCPTPEVADFQRKLALWQSMKSGLSAVQHSQGDSEPRVSRETSPREARRESEGEAESRAPPAADEESSDYLPDLPVRSRSFSSDWSVSSSDSGIAYRIRAMEGRGALRPARRADAQSERPNPLRLMSWASFSSLPFQQVKRELVRARKQSPDIELEAEGKKEEV